jgi:hypothetical protein
MTHKIGVLWDCSFSRAASSVARKAEIDLLLRVLALLKAAVDAPLSVVLFPFSCEVEEGIEIAPEDIARQLMNMDYDGGTDFSALARFVDNGSSPLLRSCNACLLFSDGFASLGREDLPPQTAMAGRPVNSPVVHTICAADRANTQLLRAVAKRFGGRFFQLPSATADAILAAILSPQFEFLGLSPVSAADPVLTSLTPEIRCSDLQSIHGGGGGGLCAYLSGCLSLASVSPNCLGDPITIHVRFGRRGNSSGDDSNVCERTYELRPVDGRPDSLGPIGFAVQKADELATEPETPATKKLMLELGRQFGLVTQCTSFIVLDSLEQYLKYEL